jgi:DNA processing protein
LEDPNYPALLAHLDNAPAAFTYRGNLGLLERPAVAMVGARNASAGACRYARTLAHNLGNLDFVVVSGLARGIDTAAHVGSLSTGTIGVIAGGIDVAYPPENRALQNEITEQGLLIAEMQPGTEPRARHFPYRNRIIAGLALGTVVVEAAPKSGSLITARLAAEAGREVMAIPGSPIDPRARGCNQLIREGATLVQDAQEVAELLSPLDHRVTQRVAPQQNQIEAAQDTGEGERKTVLDLLGMTGVAVDELVRQSGLGTPVVQMVLLELELAGRLERGAGATVKLSA